MHIELDKICVATDFSETAEYVVEYGLALATAFKAQLHLLHVVEDVTAFLGSPATLGAYPLGDLMARFEQPAQKQLDRLPASGAAGIEVARAVRTGRPLDEICRYAKDEGIDLLILGTHGRSGFRRLLIGSVAERVVRLAPCPVLTVHHPEHEALAPALAMPK